jgi:hypothetical protein
MTLKEIEAIDRPYLTPQEVASVLNCNPHSLRVQARRKPELLGFEVCIIGRYVKIPKQGFIRFFATRETT